MSTRAIYTFKDDDGSVFTVFKHWDGYPSGAYKFIQNAFAYSWELPRFEADDFGAGFIAGNKPKGGGDLRLINDATTNADVLGIEYHYMIEPEGDRLKVIARDLFKGITLSPVYITSTSISEAVELLCA